MNGWMHKCKFEIVVMVSQMYGWLDGCISVRDSCCGKSDICVDG